MPEDTPGTVEQDASETPDSGVQTTEPPAESTDSQTEQTDYEQRYNELRPNFDRVSSQIDQYEQLFQNPANLARAIQATGLSETELLQALGYDTGEEEGMEAPDPYEQRLEGIEQFMASEQQARELAEMQELEGRLNEQEIGRLEKASGSEFSDEHKQALLALAWQNLDNEGLPQFDVAHQTLKGVLKAEHENYVKSKKAPSVDIGQPGSESIDLSDENSRMKALQQVAQSAIDSED